MAELSLLGMLLKGFVASGFVVFCMVDYGRALIKVTIVSYASFYC